MKTNNKILLFGMIGIIAILLILAVVFRMNSVPRDTIAVDIPETMHNVYDLHDSIHGSHGTLQISEHACYIKIDNKNIQKRIISLKPFNSVAVGGKFHVIIKSGGKPQIKIMGEQNIMPFVQAYVEDGVLKVKIDKKAQDMFYKPVNIIIQTNNRFDQINLGGLVTLCAAEINADNLQLNIGGKIPACVLKGKVHELSINAGGEFNVNAKELHAENVSIAMAGKGNVIVTAKSGLEVSGIGEGVIHYYGTPRQVEEHGFGKITMINMSKGGGQ